jgi:uncharacterized repeat protein (TIGR01451 family)
MKKIFIGFFLLSCVFSTRAQYKYIFDNNFVSWLTTNFPAAMLGNNLDTTNIAVTSLTVAIIKNQNIADLTGIRYFDSLKVLDCSNNALTVMPTLPSTLRMLICNTNTISTWPIFPYSLQTLKFKSNQQFNMPSLPPFIKVLDFSLNVFATAPTLPNTLDTLICRSSQLVNFAIPNNLIYFDCSDNQINWFPPLPNSLKYFNCGGNSSYTTLPTLSSSLETLICYNAIITSLPSLPSTLKYLDCRSAPITTLPSLPNALEYIDCRTNQLTSLPTLPTNLQVFACSTNSIAVMPALPNSLIYLDCGQNLLTNIPSLPPNLSFLYCVQNQLTTIPPLPNTISELYCGDNNISCFDFFNPGISTLYISNNPFSCLPNYIPSMDAATLAFPLCNAGNPNACPIATGINGFIYKDLNSDCTRNSGDKNLKNIPVKIYDNLGNLVTQNYSAINGIYSFTQTANSYNILLDTTNKPYTAQCIYPGLDSMVATAGLSSNVNFALTCKPGFDVGVQSVRTNGWIFPGQLHQLSIVAGDMGYWYNLGCASGVSGQVNVTVTGNVTYVGPLAGALTPSITGNVYTYNIADFGTTNSLSQFRLLFKTNTNAQSGDTICVHIEVTPLSGDNRVSNNTYDFCYNVVNSYDPNMKEVYPIDVQPGFQDWLTYTIHFQNTGSAPAINIKLTDTLDANLDFSTFEETYFSHKNLADLSGNVLTFNFPDIYLTDSTTNAAASKGILQYRIKPKPNLPAGTQIKNRTNIFFDYNPPIITNTTINNFVSPLTTFLNELKSTSLMVYPNPAKNSLTIVAPEDIIQVNMYSILGELVLQFNTKSKHEQIDISKLNSGIYFMEIKTKEKVYTNKIIKEN